MQLVIGGAFIGMAVYEAVADAIGAPLISHVRGIWRAIVVGLFGLFIGHVVLEWAHDDVRRREDELAAAAAREWRW